MILDILTTRDAIAALEPEWHALLDTTSCNRAFSSHAWYEAASSGEASPLVLTARRDGRLVALFPLVVDPDSHEPRFASRLADYNDILAAGNDATLARPLLLAALDFAPSLHLREVRADSALLTAIRDLDLRIEREPSRPALWTSIDKGWDHWLSQRSRAFRKNLFRAQRAAAAAGLEVRELDAAEIDGEMFLKLHDSRRAEDSCFAEESNRAFLRRVLPRLLRQRRMRAFAVLEAGRIVAVDLCVAGVNSLCTWNTGFLPQYADYSPGTLLLACEIATACEERLAEFDLCRGDEAYKTSWASERRELGRLRVLR